MKHKVTSIDIALREGVFFVIYSILIILSIAMIIGASQRSTALDGMTLVQTKYFLYLIPLITVLIPLPFLLIRSYRVRKSYSSGMCAEGNINVIDINSLLITLDLHAIIDSRELKSRISFVNNKYSKTLLGSSTASICCTKEYKHPIIKNVYEH